MDFRTNRPQAVKPKEFDVGKRPRDEETEAIIQQAFEEQEHEKQLKKGPVAVQPGNPPKKPAAGKTLSEIEDEEGGPVRESMVGMASTKRALSRKEQVTTEPEADTEFGNVEEVHRAEEELEVEEEEGITFEPFNLKQEREEGFFDEEGNYVQQTDDARDAWLDSEEAAVVSEAVRQRLAREQAAMAAADAARKELSEGEIARMKLEMVAMMEPAETVTKALKRLGSDQQSRKVLTKREKQRAEQQQQQQNNESKSDSGVGPSNREKFSKLTELADILLSSGELDIYSLRREILESEAALYKPGPSLHQADASAGADEDDDMFGDDDDKPKSNDQASGGEAKAEGSAAEPSQPPAADTAIKENTNGDDAMQMDDDSAQPAPETSSAAQEGGAAGAAATQPPASSSGAHSESEPAVDYASWPVKELRRFLQERGVDSSNIVEKADLAQRVRELAEAGPEGEVAPPPAGYSFEPASGYYYSADTGLHYDPSSGGFYQSSTSKWFSWDDAAQQFVEWPTHSRT